MTKTPQTPSLHSSDTASYSIERSTKGSICVFCGSSSAAATHFTTLAKDTGRSIAEHGYRLVYGGGGVGLMGAAAKASFEAGGDVLGIIPEFLQTREITYKAVPHIVVETMHERKTIMYDQADAFIVLPGGFGTLEEAVEIMSWLRMDLHNKPIIFVDRDGYWKPMIQLLTHTIDAKFTPEWLRTHLHRTAEPDAAITLIETHWEKNPPAGGPHMDQVKA